MTESPSPDLAAAPTPPAAEPLAPPPAPAPRRGTGLLWLVVLLLLAVVAWLGWREWQRLDQSTRAADAWRSQSRALGERMDALERGQEESAAPLRRGQRALEQRLADAAATNSLLREEVLAVAERAGLLEEAIARLSEQRLRGELLLKLNEAEFLLLMGAERLRLFGDVASTLEAYQLADAVLASMDDPLASTLRDTLARELDMLADLPRDPARAAQAALDAIAAALPSLPPRGRRAEPAAEGEAPRLLGLLSQLVTVRRVATADDGAVLDPVLRAATEAALELDLATARAAAERADAQAYTSALMRAEQHLVALYDPGAARVAEVRQQLAAAAAIDLAPDLPALGATLRELTTWRTARQPLAPAARTPTQQPAPDPAPEPVPDQDPLQ